MPKIIILYYSHTGNTEKMAHAFAEGADRVQNVAVEVTRHVAPSKLASFDAVLVGAPTYHHNMTNQIKNFLEEVAFHEVELKGKIGGAFGSYGWSGEAPRLVLEVMEHKFGMDVMKPPLLVKYSPDEKSLSKCQALGETIASRIAKTS